ncbi:MAG: hypothetical protein ACKVOB_13870 [Sphingomonas sp.]
MASTGLDVSQIVDLETQVATSAAARATIGGDELVELIISIVYLIYVLDPKG